MGGFNSCAPHRSFGWDALVTEQNRLREQREAERVQREHRCSHATRYLRNTPLAWLWNALLEREKEAIALDAIGVARSVAKPLSAFVAGNLDEKAARQ